jgi:hypothetical protein
MGLLNSSFSPLLIACLKIWKIFVVAFSLLQPNSHFAHLFRRFYVVNLVLLPSWIWYSLTLRTSTFSLTTCLATTVMAWRHVHLQSRQIFWVANPNQINLNYTTPHVIILYRMLQPLTKTPTLELLLVLTLFLATRCLIKLSPRSTWTH